MNGAKALVAGMLAGVLAVAGVCSAQDGRALPPPLLPSEGRLPSLGGATGWLNSPPLTAEDLRGKVVLVDFWTYSCINWIRHLPYVRAWAEKYRSHGLVVIGVHSPEFEFEKSDDNVRQAVRDMRVQHPVAIDRNHAIWRAFDNRYWPALYFVDAHGRIRHHQFGEGSFERSERVIQQLLREAGSTVGSDLVRVEGQGLEAAADWDHLGSPETYLGHARTERFAAHRSARPGVTTSYVLPGRLKLNGWGLSGPWTMQREFVELNKAGGKIVYRFQARDVHLVLGPADQGKAVRFRVLVDGKPPGADHGIDVDAQGVGIVKEQRLYQLIRQKGRSIVDRRFEIEFLDPGVQAFAFTFG